MLPNHAPLIVAEQFGTLESLFPGRIDLGLGRAPGADHATAQALRRGTAMDPESFPRDVQELMAYFRPPASGQAITAVPGAGLHVPIWILGSSLFGAQAAAALGLPFAFASHFAPDFLHEAVSVYRRHFRPSARNQSSHVMVAANAFVADTDEEARLLFSSLQQAFIALRRGTPGPLPPPRHEYDATLAEAERTLLDRMLSASAVGTPGRVVEELERFAHQSDADELIIAAQIFDHDARLRSFELLARAAGLGQEAISGSD
jgi:luciferase family oxidoreductase group 1